jgi:uncharacterized protein
MRPGGRVLAAVVLLGCLLAFPPPSQAQEVPTIYLYVNDLASPGALVDYEENSLTELAYEIDSLSSAEVAILVVNTTLPLGIDLFAAQTFEQNAIGKAGRDNGVLIVISTDEAAWRVEVGYGLEGILPDSKVGQYAQLWLEPPMAYGDYYTGLWDLTFAIGEEIVDKYDEGTPTDPVLWFLDWKLILIAIVITIVLGVLTKGRIFLYIPIVFRRGRFGGGRSGGGGASGGS